MRVCLVSYEFPPEVGGEASYTHELASGLSSLGHQVTVLLPAKKGVAYRQEGAYRLLRVRATPLPMLKVASFVARVGALLPDLVERDGIDVIHFTFDYPSFPVGARGVGVPLVATVHHLHMAEALGSLRAGESLARGAPKVVRDFALSVFEAVLVRRAAAVVAVSRFTQESLRNYLGVPPERTRLIRNGVRFEDLLGAEDRGDARREFGLGGSPFLLYVGRLERSKGLGHLLDAFAEVREKTPALRLVLVGSGREQYTRELKRKVTALGLGDAVTFTGRVERSALVGLYAASAAVVLPSLMEGFGMTLAEGMAAGKPCIATNVGAVPEVVRDGRTGVLVPPSDPAELSRAILRVISSPDRGTGMGALGRTIVKEEFSEERMVRETAEVYDDCVKSTSPLPAGDRA